MTPEDKQWAEHYAGPYAGIVQRMLAAINNLRQQVADLANDRDTYKQGMAKVIIERDALESQFRRLTDALQNIMTEATTLGGAMEYALQALAPADGKVEK